MSFGGLNIQSGRDTLQRKAGEEKPKERQD
jgi:hypothetical protein